MRIALDAMGGDSGPELLIKGAVSAIKKRSDLEVVLLGPKDLLQEYTDQLADSRLHDRLSIAHASQTVTMHESPVDAVRKKKDSTIMVGFDLVKNGKADAVVSPGNSGATMAAAIRKLGRLKGVSRPGIASFFPTLKNSVMLMDIGANVDCRASHLLQFSLMASACSGLLLQNDNPRVGLLSIGEESGKGNAVVKDAHDLLAHSSLNFIGNVEGRDVYKGNVDVIVCDGFVGNISLKISEGFAEAAAQMLKSEIMKSFRAKIGYFFIRKAFDAFRKRVDYAEYGGAPLLGINGVGIICHGTSSSVAICNAIGVAADMVEKRVNDSITQALQRYTAQV